MTTLSHGQQDPVSTPRRKPSEAPALPLELAQSVEPRFWPKVDRRDPDECWPWTANTILGYGRLRHRPDPLYAHRVAYALHNGGLAANMTVDHLCKNRGCCNPAHLEAVTLRENIQRRNKDKFLCKNGHEFDGMRVDRRGSNYRTCSTCLRDASRRFEARRTGRGRR